MSGWALSNQCVVLAGAIAAPAENWLRERCQVVSAGVSETAFDDACPDATALLVRTDTAVTDDLLARMPNLRVVGRAGVGLDNIDLEACRQRGIEVVYTPDANTQAVVEYVMCLLCDAFRPRMRLAHPVDEGEWRRLRASVVGQRQLNELTIGILGLGRIGRGVARVASAVGSRVVFNDLRDIPDAERGGATAVDVDNLFTISDVLTIHIDGRPSNRDFVNARLIERMKADVVLINTARGSVVDNLSLSRFLAEHKRARAFVDVHEHEPFDERDPLTALENAHLYPHLAARTRTALANMSWVVRDVVAVLEGREPRRRAAGAS